MSQVKMVAKQPLCISEAVPTIVEDGQEFLIAETYAEMLEKRVLAARVATPVNGSPSTKASQPLSNKRAPSPRNKSAS